MSYVRPSLRVESVDHRSLESRVVYRTIPFRNDSHHAMYDVSVTDAQHERASQFLHARYLTAPPDLCILTLVNDSPFTG